MRIFLRNVLKTIDKYRMFDNDDGVVVALSGGADSMALLAALLALRGQWRLRLYAAHVNHGLRAEAGRDEDFVREYCESRDIPVRIFRADVAAKAKREKSSIEEAGRRFRRRCYREALAAVGAQKIATGHHQDDNAETVLFNLARGAGLKGLCGIAPVSGNVVRPLIETPRREIEAFLRANNIPYVTDATNATLDYARNRVRHVVLPALCEHIHPQAGAAIARGAALLRADMEYLEDAAAAAYNMCVRKGSTSIDILRLNNLPEAMRTRVVREAICRMRDTNTGDYADIHARHIAAVLDIAGGMTGREAKLPGGTVRREYDDLCFFKNKKTADDSGGFFYALALDVPVYIPETDKTICITLAPPAPGTPHLLCTKPFNCDILQADLAVRTRRPKDRILLTGAGGKPFTKKLQDYFTDAKTPRHKRDSVPLAAAGSDILWIMDENNRACHLSKRSSDDSDCWITIYGGIP